jgi:xylono-1,5-lactonase
VLIWTSWSAAAVLPFHATHTDMAAVLQATPQCVPCPAALGEVRSVWTAQASYGAAPLWSARESALYWIDAAGDQLHRYQPVRRLRDSWSLGQRISAIAERIDQAGLLVALQRDLVFFDPELARIQALHRVEPGLVHNRLGSGQCDAHGRFWLCTESVGDTTAMGGLYRYAGGSRCTRLLGGLANGAGLTWSLDQRTLWVSSPALGHVLAYAANEAQDTLGEARRWIRVPRHEGMPKGMCTDASGRIWLAHYGAGCVTAHDPDNGTELLRIAIPAKWVTGCAFGGDNLRTLFITTASRAGGTVSFQEPLAGALFAVEVNGAGLPAQLFAG